MRQYFFHDGVYENTFTSEREARTAAQRYANRTGKKVAVHYRNVLTGKTERRGGAKYRKNPDSYPPMRSSDASKPKYIVRCYTNRDTQHILYANSYVEAKRIVNHNNGRFRTMEIIKADSFYGRKNPASLGRSTMATRYRALDYQSALNALLTKARKAPPPKLDKRTGEITVYSVTLPQLKVTEQFGTKAAAKAWAKAAEKQGFQAHVY
jgi:hypothetical protein